MLVMAFQGSVGHACESWAELVRKCGYKAVVTKQECGEYIVEIKPNNTYSKLVPPFKQWYVEEYPEFGAVEYLCRLFAIKFLSKNWRIIDVHMHCEWASGKPIN